MTIYRSRSLELRRLLTPADKSTLSSFLTIHSWIIRNMNHSVWNIWLTKMQNMACRKLITSPFFPNFPNNRWLQKMQDLFRFRWKDCMLGAHLETLADAELQFWYLTICILYFISKLPQLQMVIFIPERASFLEIPNSSERGFQKYFSENKLWDSEAKWLI